MNVTIVGLGRVGSSLGLALKAASSDVTITGHDPEGERVSQARKLGAIDKSHWNLVSACEKADLVLLDVELEAVENTLRALRDTLKERVLVMDLVPVKRPVVAWAEAILPETVQFVGGHVIFPPKARGQAQPSAAFLQGATFYLVALQRTAPWALEMATNLALAVGAKPLHIDAAEHDGLMAAMLGLPLLSVLAFLEAIKAEAGREGRAQSVGEEFAALADLVLGAPDMAMDLMLANVDNILYWLDAYRARLDILRSLISAKDRQGLQAMFDSGRRTCAEWLLGEREAHSELSIEDVNAGFRAMFLGNLGRKLPR